MTLTDALFQALISPWLLFGEYVLAFSWPAAIVISGAIALAVGALLALNYGTKAPRWIFVPIFLTHAQVFADIQWGMPAWWVVVVLLAASIGWLVWKCREIPVAAALLGWACLVYGGAHIGLMGVLADTMRDFGGEVIGVIPRSLVEWEVAHTGLSDLRVVGQVNATFLLLESGDGLVARDG